MPFFKHSGIEFHFELVGQGTPFIFQHGLGGDTHQPLNLLQTIPGYCLAAFDCRGHGDTRPSGSDGGFTLASFADDLLAFLNHLGHRRAVIGGISMGAAVALNFALRFPERLAALVLSRPAWLDQPAPPNLAIYDLVAGLIRRRGATQGLVEFMQTDIYHSMAQESPDAANSLVGQFNGALAETAIIRLERIPHCAPISTLADLQEIHVPTLVMANRQDPVHPFEYGLALARAIQGAVFFELTPKSISREQHEVDVRTYVKSFLATLPS